MYNLRARYYNPATGTFNQRDTFAGRSSDPQSLHKYAYAEGDPINGSDPTGHDTFTLPNVLAVALIATMLYLALITPFTLRRAGPIALPTFDWPRPTSTSQEPETSRDPKPVPAPQPLQTADDDDDSRDLLYRGVPITREDDYRRALLGIALPRGKRLDLDALTRHVNNEVVDSGVTHFMDIASKQGPRLFRLRRCYSGG
jgi:hypothetical protein